MTPAPKRQLYVYWTTAASDAAVAAVRVMQGRLTALIPGLQAELLRREDDSPPLVTLMEIYRHPAGIDLPLQQRIDRALVAVTRQYCLGERHTEVFIAG